MSELTLEELRQTVQTCEDCAPGPGMDQLLLLGGLLGYLWTASGELVESTALTPVIYQLLIRPQS